MAVIACRALRVPAPLYRPKRKLINDQYRPLFNADQLYERMLHPTVASKDQIQQMQEQDAENRLQDVWCGMGALIGILSSLTCGNSVSIPRLEYVFVGRLQLVTIFGRLAINTAHWMTTFYSHCIRKTFDV